MKHEIELKLMASLDGELSAAEAREITVLVEQDAAARALRDELAGVRQAMRGNELVVPAPETRDFYWSKIEQAISRLPADEAQPGLSWRQWLAAGRRWMAPVAGTAAAALILAASGVFTPRGPAATAGYGVAEVEDLSEHVQSQTFRAGNFMVVWVDTKESHSPVVWEPTEPPTVQ